MLFLTVLSSVAAPIFVMGLRESWNAHAKTKHDLKFIGCNDVKIVTMKYCCRSLLLTLRTSRVSLVARPWQSSLTASSSTQLMLRSSSTSVSFCCSTSAISCTSGRPNPLFDSWSCFSVVFTWGKKRGERRSATRVNKTELFARVCHFSHL